MAVKCWMTYPRVLCLISIWIGSFLAAPACLAGGAVKIIPDKRQFAPRGSYIPDRRAKQVLEKVEKHKAAMRAKEALQHQEQMVQPETPKHQKFLDK